jgi:hypothetical protein
MALTGFPAMIRVRRITVQNKKTGMCSGFRRIRAESAVIAFAGCSLGNAGAGEAGGVSGARVVTFGGEGGAPGEAQMGVCSPFVRWRRAERTEFAGLAELAWLPLGGRGVCPAMDPIPASISGYPGIPVSATEAAWSCSIWLAGTVLDAPILILGSGARPGRVVHPTDEDLSVGTPGGAAG